VKITVRHILMAVAWGGLLLGHRALGNDSNWAVPDASAHAGAEVIPAGPEQATEPNARRNVGPAPDQVGSNDGGVVGEHESPANGIFGDEAPAVCEFCGGGNCLPPEWSLDTSVQLMATSRAGDRVLGTTSLPFGPLQVTSGTIAGQPLEYAFVNNAVNTSALEVHTLDPTVSPALDLTVTHFLGRDGENRDHFVDIEFSGLERFYAGIVVQGTVIPVYSPTVGSISQTTPGTVILFTGSLISPFTFPHSVANSPFINPPINQNYNPTNAYAFNGATQQTATTVSTFNNWEVNYRFAGNNQQDQMVLNPNGHWYRQCKTGYFYSYLFGIRAMEIDEKFDFTSSGATYNAVNNQQTNLLLASAGRYVARTQNTLIGLQTGGTLEYRFCRWALETHSKVGMFMNIANQDSLIQTSLHGYEYNDGDTPVDSNTSTAYNSGKVGVAFAGGFGVGGSYKFRPNLVGHVSYDMLWVGDIARASDQMQFTPNITPQIDTKGSQFYDGMTFGLEYDW